MPESANASKLNRRPAWFAASLCPKRRLRWNTSSPCRQAGAGIPATLPSATSPATSGAASGHFPKSELKTDCPRIGGKREGKMALKVLAYSPKKPVKKFKPKQVKMREIKA